MDKQKPIVLVWEPDQAKGGAPITALVEELYERRQMLADLGSTPEACEEYVFRTSQADGRPIIPWHRIKDFQLMSLTMIAQSGLVDSPAYAARRTLKFYIPKVTSDPKKLISNKPVCLYTSPFNPGAAEAAAELATAVLGLSATDRPPDGCGAIELELPAWDDASSEATHFLLYLSDETFVGDVGKLFAEQMRVVKARGIPYLMIHENDPERHGCEFGHFFSTTPQDLIENGIYGPLAITFSWGEHRQVSLVLAAKVLGAVEKQGSNQLAQLRARRSQVSSKLALTKRRIQDTVEDGANSFKRATSLKNVKIERAPEGDATAGETPEGDLAAAAAGETKRDPEGDLAIAAASEMKRDPEGDDATTDAHELRRQDIAARQIQRVARGFVSRSRLDAAGVYNLRAGRGYSTGYWHWPQTFHWPSSAATATVLRQTLAAARPAAGARKTWTPPPGFPPGHTGTEDSTVVPHHALGPAHRLTPTPLGLPPGYNIRDVMDVTVTARDRRVYPRSATSGGNGGGHVDAVDLTSLDPLKVTGPGHSEYGVPQWPADSGDDDSPRHEDSVAVRFV